MNVLRHLLVFAAYLAAAIFLTWPLAARLDTTVSDLGDPLLNAWIIDWVSQALTHAPLSLYDAPIFHPARFPLAYSENMVGIALMVLPVHLAGAPAIALHSVAMLLGFAFSGYGMFVLARLVTRHSGAAFVAGLLFAFVPFRFSHLAHVQIIGSGWLPLLLAALLAYWREPTRLRALLLGAAFVMNGLSNIHWLLYGGFALVVTIAFLGATMPRRERVFWVRLMVTLGVAGLVLLPFLIPYQVVADEYGMRRTSSDARGGSANLLDWLVAPENHIAYGRVVPPSWRHLERELFPGLLVLLLGACAVVWHRHSGLCDRGDRQECLSHTLRVLDVLIVLSVIAVVIGLFLRRWDVAATLLVTFTLIRLFIRYPWGEGSLRDTIARSRFSPELWAAFVWIAIGVLASLGENGFLHPFLYRVVHAFRATRTPARWAMIAYVGLAVWAAAGVVVIARRRWVVPVLALLAVLEARPRIRWEQAEPPGAPVYRWLNRERPRVAIELPIHGGGNMARYVLASTIHRVPMMNGVSGWEPPLHETLRKKEAASQFDDEFLALLEQNGCEVVIVHEALLRDEAPALRAWLDAQTAAGRLSALRRFGDDEVFALTARSTRSN